MFTGIVEATSQTIKTFKDSSKDLLRFLVQRPPSFDDIEIGDSIATNGICLTVESFDQDSIQFALGAETLKITGWTPESVSKMTWNLERSLCFGDRIHGHLVTGHVDFTGRVLETLPSPESLGLKIQFPISAHKYFWPKGSVCLNGVSLTINEVGSDFLRVHLIPETLKATNLGALQVGHVVNIEVDSFARGMIHYFQEREPGIETPLR